MAKQIDRIGFGQVEPNHMSYKRTGQIYAQLPAASDIEVLDNKKVILYDIVDYDNNIANNIISEEKKREIEKLNEEINDIVRNDFYRYWED